MSERARVAIVTFPATSDTGPCTVVIALVMPSQISSTAAAMCLAAAAFGVLGLVSARDEIASSRGLDRILVLTHLSIAVPLAVFSALHFAGPQFVSDVVPPFMPWRMFWVYFVGAALMSTALSVAARVEVRLSGLLFGMMMFLFVAMIHLPGAICHPHNRIVRTIVFREMSFGGAAWILAGLAARGVQPAKTLIAVGRAFVTIAMVVFGVEHFFHPTVLPVVPLAKEMPAWVPAGALIDYLTGSLLLIAAGSVLLNRNARTVVSFLGAWILALMVFIYTPVLFSGLAGSNVGGQIEGVNYFADTLLFAGAVLAVAKAMPRSDVAG
jgi:uncharacterized membrane protein